MKKNIILQMFYQLLAVIVPFITTPYLSRTLGAEQIGIYSYTYSYIYYFSMVAMLGFASYGSKEIASVQGDLKLRNKKFWGIYLAQLSITVISMIIFVVFLVGFCDNDIKKIMLFQGIYLLACLFDVNWYFFGIEQFSVTVTRNIIVKILSVFMILFTVKTEKDLLQYIAIMAGAQLLNNIIIVVLALNREKFFFPPINDILGHLKESASLFIPVAAMSIYHLMDKTMLGILSDNTNSGFYYSTDKVINIPLCAISGIGTVMLPRISSIVSTGDENESRRIFKVSYRLYICLSCAMVYGIAGISPEFVPLFFGNGYEPCIMLISVMALALPFKALSDMFRTQFLIPKRKKRIYIISVFFGAGLNLFLNYFLIKVLSLGAMGATVATVVTEFAVCIIQGCYIFNEIKITLLEIVSTILYVSFGAIMYFCVRKTAGVIQMGIKGVLTEICVGVIVYGTLCVIYWLKNKSIHITME